jgi:polyisoprenoid-binding protein YceI
MQTTDFNAFRNTLILLSVMLATGTVHAAPANWEIDPEHFSITFGAGHVGYQHQMGMFLDASGSFRYDPETRELSGGRVEVRADSIFSNHDERDGHLRSDDFLDASNHPFIVFEATGYTSDDENGGTLTGDLTLLGNTHPVELDVTINKHDTYPFGHRRETLGISARATIQRSRWGMDYALDLVGDEVMLRFEFEALRQ